MKKYRKLYFYLIFLLSLDSMADVTIPGDDFVPGWKKTNRLLLFKKSDLFNYINGGAELFHEFGFNELIVQRYGKGEAEVTLEVYQMHNPVSALGIYLMKCGHEKTIEGIPARHSGNQLQFTIVKGNFFILINNSTGDESVIPVMISLSQYVLNSVPEGDQVKLLRMLPQENLVSGSERIIRGPYALEPIYTFGKGDILQLKGNVFGLIGDYRDNENYIYTRILIPYSHGNDALKAYQNLIVNLDPYIEVMDNWETGFVFKDYKSHFGITKIENHMIDIKINLLEQPVPR